MTAFEPELVSTLGRELDGAPPGERRVVVPLDRIAAAAAELAGDGRFLTLAVAGDHPNLVVALHRRGQVIELAAPLGGDRAYPAVSSLVPAAGWAEREARDLHDLRPADLPDRRPIVSPDADDITRQISGDDAFVMPYGPIRSGVFEAIQFVIETGGEDIPKLDVRTGFKRRGLERRMAGLAPGEGVVVAERIAGISSVAHALAYCQAVERLAGVDVPLPAQHWRVIHAELERIANHLHSAAQLAETTALSVGSARMSMLKEEVLRLRAQLCGSRFGRGAVIPGGVAAAATADEGLLIAAIDRLDDDLRQDRRLLVGTASFVDRLIGTGRLSRADAERWAVVGPVARGSGVSTDARYERPYAAYGRLGWELPVRSGGDAMSRLEVRLAEIAQSIHLIRQAHDALRRAGSDLALPVAVDHGAAWGWSEAAQGELLYRVEIAGGRIAGVHVASPSLRNWQVYGHCFPKDVLTDFGFIEHSFQLTPAGADR